MNTRNLLYTLIFSIFTTIVTAQDFSGQWTGHYSYLQIKAVTESTTKIYSAAENAVFSYDIASGETQKLSTVNGLSGQKTSTLYYSESFKALIIGYENGIIEVIFDGNDDVFTAVDIRDKATLGETEKRINHFIENGNILYVSTNFGIIEFDLNQLEFGDTFFIGPGNSSIPVAQTAFFEGNIFAATRTSGILIADQNSPNLIDSGLWNTVQTGNFSGIQTFGNAIYAALSGNQLLKYNGTSFIAEVDYGAPILGIHSNESHFTTTLANNVISYDSSFNEVSTITLNTTEIPSAYTTATSLDGIIYFGTTTDGMYTNTFNSSTTANRINPSGPSLNIPRTVDVSNGNLWIAYGQYRGEYVPVPDTRGISNFDPNTNSWTNIPFSELFGASPIISVAINPNNSNQVFFGCYQKGLLEVVDKEPTILYDHINTDQGGSSTSSERLESLVDNTAIVRIQNLFFNNDELWFTNDLITNTGIKKLTLNTNTISSIDFGSLINAEAMRFGDLLINENNTMFLGSLRQGLIAHDIGTNRFRSITSGLDDTVDVRAIAVDNNDQIWVGATNGLRILSNASSVFQQQNPVLNDIVIRENGVNQQILNGQFIWDIKVDGSNNKWVATENSGVFYLSADGEEALEHFTTENSPLPSNFVQEIAIDGASGAVYFATQGGLVQYQGLATESNENLDKLRAFPNPVRPGYNKLVTIDGLTENANVKITDIEGNLVFETVSQGGSVQWDTRAFGQHKVASGVYLVLVTGEELVETKVAKLMIVR